MAALLVEVSKVNGPRNRGHDPIKSRQIHRKRSGLISIDANGPEILEHRLNNVRPPVN
jgi:hypothetical protein